MGDAIDFCIHISTPVEKVATMKERITRYMISFSSAFVYWYTLYQILYLLWRLHLQVYREQDRSLVSSSIDCSSGLGWHEQAEDINMALTPNELPGHGWTVGKESLTGWRDDQSLQRAWYWISYATCWCQCPQYASCDLHQSSFQLVSLWQLMKMHTDLEVKQHIMYPFSMHRQQRQRKEAYQMSK